MTRQFTNIHFAAAMIFALSACAMNAKAADPCAGAWNTAFNAEGLDGETIYALAVYEGDLIAGGTFSAGGDWFANHVARWDGVQWQPLGAGTDGDVRALLVHDDDLYAGGFFTEAGGQTVNHIARWDGEQWHPVSGGFNNAVMTMTEYDGTIAAGGLFTHAGGIEVNRVARYLQSSNIWLPIDGGMNGTVLTLNNLGVGLVAGGRFTMAGSNEARNAAFLKDNLPPFGDSGWHPFDGPLPNGWLADGPNNPVWVMERSAGGVHVLMGGSFIYIHRQGFHPYNLSPTVFTPLISFRSALSQYGAWELIAEPQNPPNRIIRTILSDDADVFAGGDFTRVGDNEAWRLARLNGTEWQSVGHGVGGPLTTAVHDMVKFDGEIIVAGFFNDAVGQPATSIAGWNGAMWAGPADLNCDGSVGADDLFVLLGEWGQCADCDDCPADITGDCIVDVEDLFMLLANWG